MTSTLAITDDPHALFRGIDIADEPLYTGPTPFNHRALANLTGRTLGE
jgi:hypothetical protein